MQSKSYWAWLLYCIENIFNIGVFVIGPFIKVKKTCSTTNLGAGFSETNLFSCFHANYYIIRSHDRNIITAKAVRYPLVVGRLIPNRTEIS
jgi:hypothetical protein